MDVVSLAEAKAHLNITEDDADPELAVFVTAASQVIEDYVGPVVHRPVTDRLDGGRPVVLLTARPVAAVVSVTDGGSVLPPDAYTVGTAAGVVIRRCGPGAVAAVFTPGPLTVEVAYVAGRAATTASVLARYKAAALMIVQHLWETQRPAAAGPFTQGGDDYDPRYAYSIPRRALELLGEPIGGIA